jgi:hypothetical protein
MDDLMWRPRVAVWMIALSACGYPPLAPLGGDGGGNDGDRNDGGGNDGLSQPPFPSCVGLPPTCGGSGNDSCCNGSGSSPELAVISERRPDPVDSGGEGWQNA